MADVPHRGRRAGVDGGLVAAAVIAIIGLVVLALRPGSTTIGYDDTPPVVAPDDGTAIVTTLRAPGGLAPFGIQLVDPTHTVTVQFVSDPECISFVDSGDPWPTPHPACTGGDGVVGDVAGYGITADGASLIGVSVTVGRDCYEQVEVGMPWPSGLAACGTAD